MVSALTPRKSLAGLLQLDRPPKIYELGIFWLSDENILRLNIPMYYILKVHYYNESDTVFKGSSCLQKEFCNMPQLPLGREHPALRIPLSHVPMLAIIHEQVNFLFLLVFQNLMEHGNILVVQLLPNLDLVMDLVGLSCVLCYIKCDWLLWPANFAPIFIFFFRINMLYFFMA